MPRYRRKRVRAWDHDDYTDGNPDRADATIEVSDPEETWEDLGILGPDGVMLERCTTPAMQPIGFLAVHEPDEDDEE